MGYTYPLMLDVTDRLAVIVGGGGVAVRKARGLIAAGATRIRCVSPAFCSDLPISVERIPGVYAERHLEGASLVFAVTNDRQVNNAVVRDAKHRGIPVSRADNDDSQLGDFISPAKLELGPVIVTVSAGSAAVSAAIRDDLSGKMNKRLVTMAEAMIVLRPLIRESQLDPAHRAALFREMTGDEALSILDIGGIEALRGWLLGRLPELKHG